MTGHPEISVIIPTRDRAELLSRSLRSFCGQTLSPAHYEVVVVDDGSCDDTPDRCRAVGEALPLRYARIEPSGTSAAKNLAIFLARGRLLLFFDDDDRAAPDLLEQHLLAHGEHPSEGVAVLGHTTWAPELDVTPLMRYVMDAGWLFSYGFISEGEMLDFRFLWAGRTSVKRRFLTHAAVFNQDLEAVEDVELGFRLVEKGLRVAYWPSARSFMARPVTFDEFCRRCEKQGEGRLRFSRLHHHPAVQEYCAVEEAERTWASAEHHLDDKVRRARHLQGVVASDWAHGRASPREADLFQLFDYVFRAFQARGTVLARRAATERPYRLGEVLEDHKERVA